MFENLEIKRLREKRTSCLTVSCNLRTIGGITAVNLELSIWKRGCMGLSGDQMEWYSSVLSFFLILRILPSVFCRVVEKTNCGGTCRPLAVRKCFGRRDFVGHSSVAVAEVIYRSKVLPSLRCFVFYFLQQSVSLYYFFSGYWRIGSILLLVWWSKKVATAFQVWPM